MAKNSILYGCILFIALCLYSLFSSTAVAQSSAMQHAAPFRKKLAAIYRAELGVREASGRNDGERVSTYLAYCGLAPGHEWCAAFVSWCYAQAGRMQPRNPWAPALVPRSRLVYGHRKVIGQLPMAGDVFGIYNSKQQRVVHVGFIDEWQVNYVITVEGNSNNTVERRRRLIASLHSVADWTTP